MFKVVTNWVVWRPPTSLRINVIQGHVLEKNNSDIVSWHENISSNLHLSLKFLVSKSRNVLLKWHGLLNPIVCKIFGIFSSIILKYIGTRFSVKSISLIKKQTFSWGFKYYVLDYCTFPQKIPQNVLDWWIVGFLIPPKIKHRGDTY